MRTTGEGGSQEPAGGPGDEEQRRQALDGLAHLDELTAADEEEISRFRAFVSSPLPRPRSIAWPRRRPALPL